jgi:hypothetical protein
MLEKIFAVWRFRLWRRQRTLAFKNLSILGIIWLINTPELIYFSTKRGKNDLSNKKGSQLSLKRRRLPYRF